MRVSVLFSIILLGCNYHADGRNASIICDSDAGSCDVDAGAAFHRNLGIVWQVGDSTIEGDEINGNQYVQSGGYRTEFYRLAQAYGVAYSTTGTLSIGPGDPTLPTTRYGLHDGHSGLETRQMLLAQYDTNPAHTGMPTWLEQLPQTPTFVVIQGGINDINHAYQVGACVGTAPNCINGTLVVTDPGYEISHLADRLLAMAQLALEACHFQCRVAVATITPVCNKTAAMDYWNPIIRNAVANTPSLELIDLAAAVDISKISSDCIHPNAFGYSLGGIEEAKVAFGSLP